jgi:hypothetical protein
VLISAALIAASWYFDHSGLGMSKQRSPEIKIMEKDLFKDPV